jgi:hypothetical protein
VPTECARCNEEWQLTLACATAIGDVLKTIRARFAQLSATLLHSDILLGNLPKRTVAG